MWCFYTDVGAVYAPCHPGELGNSVEFDHRLTEPVIGVGELHDGWEQMLRDHPRHTFDDAAHCRLRHIHQVARHYLKRACSIKAQRNQKLRHWWKRVATVAAALLKGQAVKQLLHAALREAIARQKFAVGVVIHWIYPVPQPSSWYAYAVFYVVKQLADAEHIVDKRSVIRHDTSLKERFKVALALP